MNPLDRGKPLSVNSVLIAFRERPWTTEAANLKETLGSSAQVETFSGQEGHVLLGWRARQPSIEQPQALSSSESRWIILGDCSELDASAPLKPMANGAQILFEPSTQSLVAVTSIVGLPPLYLVESAGHTILTSDLLSLTAICPEGLAFDAEGVLDLCAYGFPVAYRTLFQGVRLVPGGSIVKWKAGKPAELSRAWEFEERERLKNWEAYTRKQMEAFFGSVRRMTLDQTFLSLTAGLDTRTILAALVKDDRKIPAYTLSGETLSLDARTARAVCRRYNIPHEIIPLGADFKKCLAECTLKASKHSGGLSSLGQAHQVYLYKKLGSRFTARISGNMGNQLGRKGVEHVRMRAADPRVLNPELQRRLSAKPRFAWASENTGGAKTGSYEFLFQQEFSFTQLGNYSIGDHYAVQQSPYATRDLIALCCEQPEQKESPNAVSPLRMRWKDLRHRFLGEPEEHSFQRRLIHEVGGVVASYPINWGWRARGGLALSGVFWGGLALIDAYTERAGWVEGKRAHILRSLQIAGLHEHRKPGNWLKHSLRELAYDELLSQASKSSGLFDVTEVSRLLDEHYSGKTSHHGALVFALDLALAAKNFQARFAGS